jgi:hypothetical protein
MGEPNNKSERDELGRKWFENYCDVLEHQSVQKPPIDGVHYRCPCCGYRTLEERGGFDICAVCFWEDDGQDDHDAGVVRGGPNGSLSLTQSRSNFAEFGASDRKSLEHVRKPTADEE